MLYIYLLEYIYIMLGKVYECIIIYVRCVYGGIIVMCWYIHDGEGGISRMDTYMCIDVVKRE